MQSADLKDALRQPFCEFHRLAPVSLEGRRLSIIAVDPGGLEAGGALVLLRNRYDVDISAASDDDVKAQLRRVFEPEPEPSATPTAPPPPFTPPTNAVGKTCPFCQTPIKPGVAVHACPVCGIAHHDECWRANGGCTTFGCVAGARPAQPFGQPTTAYAPPPTFGAPAPPPAYTYAGPVRVDDHLTESILVAIFCCPATGIASICFSATARARAGVGDLRGASSAAAVANALNIISIVLGLFFVLGHIGGC